MKSDSSSIDKVFGLLEFLARENKPVSLQAATESVGLSKPTAYRLLQSLQKLGYVSRPMGSRDYVIGQRTALLSVADPWPELKSSARPLLRKIHEELNETVNLAVLSNDRVNYLDFIETTQPLRFIVTPGQSDPYYCTALGRAIAAQLSDGQFERLLSTTKLTPLTPYTVASVPELRRRIHSVRETGVAEEIEETVLGVCCLAVSLASMGHPEAAISIAVPVQRLTPQKKNHLVKALKRIQNPRNRATQEARS
jgi:DNA-binding IclR family transcriptional regulator